MEELQIQVFGGLSISQNGLPISGFISAKVPALLAYLAINRRAHNRDSLAALLWGKMAETDAKNNLRQALSNLRKLLEPYLLVTRDMVQFNVEVPCFLDTEAFRQELESGDLTAAAALYQGDFLAGFQVRDAPAFEEWVLAQQVQWHEQAMRVLDDLTAYHTNRGEYPQAIDAANRLLAIDPWREEAHRQVMLLQARRGQYSAALAQYQTCRATLRREFNTDPSRETTALYERIRAIMNVPHHNLPAAVTGFVGRESEVAEARRLLASPNVRILTLLGPGGVGKTRLALETAAACQMMFLEGVWFVPMGVDLTPSRGHLAIALADALGCVLSDGGSPEKQLAAFLRPKELLLVIDNLEEWLEAVALLSDLLVQAAEIKILATSRQRLNLQTEQVFYLEGLATGDSAHFEAQPPAASRLFIQRAGRLQPDFDPTENERVAIYRICQMLGGLPLGIEMAAAWVHQLPCAEIAAQIEASLDFLQSSFRDAPPRQASLRAVFDWSWDRLSLLEKETFQKLAVFSGPFTQTAAHRVAEASPKILSTLIDKSLLWRRNRSFQMHEVTRQFGLENLKSAGESEDLHRQHARHYAGWLAEQGMRIESADQQAVLAEIEAEFENVRQAWDWLAAQGDAAGITAALDGLYHFLAIRSRFVLALDMFASARKILQDQKGDYQLAELTAYRLQAREGRFLSFLSRFEDANSLLLDCLEYLRTQNEPDETAFVLGHLGGTARMQGHLSQARQWLEEGLELRRQTGSLQGQAVALLELAGVAFMAADYAAARAQCWAGLSVAEQSGDQQTLAHLLTGLSLSCRELGELEISLDFGKRAAAVYEALADRYGVIQATLTLGELSRQLGNFDEARQYCWQAIQVSEEIGYRSGAADGRYRLGQIEAGLGDTAAAQKHLFQALELARECRELPQMYDTLFELAGLLCADETTDAANIVLAWLQNQPETSGQTLGRIAAHFSQMSPQRAAQAAKSSQPKTGDEIIQLVRAGRIEG